jgi:hypothetical protein
MKPGPHSLLVLAVILLVAVAASGCTAPPEEDFTDSGSARGSADLPENITNLTNGIIPASLFNDRPGFIFRIYQDNLVMKANKSVNFPLIFNNVGEDNLTHNYTARFIPSEVDFDVKAAYLCQYFSTCSELQSDMESFITYNTTPLEIAPGFVGLLEISLAIPENASAGLYMYGVMGCRDVPYEQCTRTTANFGPVLPFSVEVVEYEPIIRNYS